MRAYNTKFKIDILHINKENKRTNIELGNILLAIIGASIGNIAIYDIEDKVVAQRAYV